MRYSFLAFAVLGFIALGGVWFYGQAQYNNGKKDCEAQYVEREEKTREKHHDNKKQIKRIADIDLVRRYCKFVWSLPYDECVRTVRPIP